MSVLTYSDLDQRLIDRLGVNTTEPFDTATRLRHLNDAYGFVYSLSGGRIKKVASATAWTTAQSATGVVTGILTDIEDVIDVFASTTSGSTGFSSGDYPLTRVDYARIQSLRGAQGLGTYARPINFSLIRLATTTPASVNLMQLDYWPSVTAFYFPTHYVPQFTVLDASTVTTPDVNDLESQDIYLLAGVSLAPLMDRPDFVPGLMADLTDRTRQAKLRALNAMVSGKQDA